jgi:hypothetical protein
VSSDKKRGNRSVRDYGRPTRFATAGKTILIVTEGKNTEVNYFTALRNRLKLSATDIQVIHPEGTDPITLTRAAVKLRSQRKKKEPDNPFDEVWVVFDLEKQHNERRAQAQQARNVSGAREIKFIESDPSFEYWRLLHEKNGYTTKFLPDSDATLKELKKHCPAYTKSEIPDSHVLNNIPLAVKRAKQGRKYHKESGGNGNPSTNADLLVRSMNSATRKHLQFTLPPKD